MKVQMILNHLSDQVASLARPYDQGPTLQGGAESQDRVYSSPKTHEQEGGGPVIEHDPPGKRVGEGEEIDQAVNEKDDHERNKEGMETLSDLGENFETIGIGGSVNEKPESWKDKKPMDLAQDKGKSEIESPSVGPDLQAEQNRNQ
jgi:hypothetical protein